MKKVLWIGTVINNEYAKENVAISPAANVWQLSFIEGLIQNGLKLTIISNIPNRTWPRGKFWISKNKYFSHINGSEIFFVSYLNITWLREIWIGLGTIILILSKKLYKKVDVCFTYNPIYRHLLPAVFIKLVLNVKWISIVADGFVKGRSHLNLFLSYKYFSDYRGKKYFLDGGLQIINDLDNQIIKNKKLLFAGSITNVTGILEFARVFSKIKNNKYELHIYGNGMNGELVNLARSSSKIFLHGFVTDNELHYASCEAFAFINPRANSHMANTTFPSKLLHYLSYKKPIISAKIESLSPKYNELLIIYENLIVSNLTDCFAILESLDRKKFEQKVENFAIENNWNTLVKNLVNNHIN